MGINNNFVPVAIYNTDDKKLAAIAMSVAEASKYIFGRGTIEDFGVIQRRLKNGNLLDKEKTLHDFTIKVKYASVKQVTMLGKDKIHICLTNT